MTLSTWQLVVVGVLLGAWVIVLGGPAVVDGYRWFNGRSHRRHARQHTSIRSTGDHSDSETDDGPSTVHTGANGVSTGGSGRLRRAHSDGSTRDVHEPTGNRPGPGRWLRSRWRERPRPVAAWRAQDVVQRRIQLLLGLSAATFSSMFLAIALRGVFVRLFLLMLGVMAVSLAVAAYVGAVELRHHRAQAGDRRAVEPRPSRILDEPSPSAAVSGHDGFGPMTMADEGFRQTDQSEPGLIFEPLNLDEIVSELGRDRHGARWGEEIWVDDGRFEVPIDPELARELGIEETVGRNEQGPDVEAEPAPAPDRRPSQDVTGEYDRQGGRNDATFAAAPEAGARQASARARSMKKRQARPIYIESTLDDEENQWKAANDQ